MAGEVCSDCGRPAWDGHSRDSDICVRISGYWPTDVPDDCREVTIANLRTQLKAAEARLHRAWVPCAERMPEAGQHVLLVDVDYGVQAGIWCTGYAWETLDGLRIRSVTNWMPLPQPPEVKHGDG